MSDKSEYIGMKVRKVDHLLSKKGYWIVCLKEGEVLSEKDLKEFSQYETIIIRYNNDQIVTDVTPIA